MDIILHNGKETENEMESGSGVQGIGCKVQGMEGQDAPMELYGLVAHLCRGGLALSLGFKTHLAATRSSPKP